MASYFPHLTATGPAPTANEIYTIYRKAFFQQLSDGIRRPQVYPLSYLSVFIAIIYLCIPHKQNPVVYAARWPLVGLITWFEIRAIQQVSGVGLGMGFIAGMQSFFIIMWIWTWLIFKRPQWDAKRVERRRVRVIKDVKKVPISEKTASKEEENSKKSADDTNLLPSENSNKETYEYFWQSYPDDLRERISWVLDLLLNYRGPGWDWSVPIVRTLTPETLSKLENPPKDEANSKNSSAPRKCNNSSCEIIREIFLLIFCYLLLDVLWVLMMQDPYFKFGPTTYELPSHLKNLNPYVLYLYRLTLTGTIIITSMRTGYAIFNNFVIHVLGSKVLGLRGEPWYYNQVWGDFSNVFDRGLGGLWGNFWHQTFRNFFTAPTSYLLKKGYIKPGKFTTKLTGLAFAFILSGLLHYASMFTVFGDAYPSNEILFFGLQGVGVAIQSSLSKAFSPLIVKLPARIRQIGNFIFTLAWFYLTGWLESDNVGRSGVLLIPLVPFSPLIYFGLGEPDANWICWESFNYMWYTGKNWFDSGFFIYA